MALIQKDISQAVKLINQFTNDYLKSSYGRNHDCSREVCLNPEYGFPNLIADYEVVYCLYLREYRGKLAIYFAVNADFQLKDLAAIDFVDRKNHIEKNWAFVEIGDENREDTYYPSYTLLGELRDLSD